MALKTGTSSAPASGGEIAFSVAGDGDGPPLATAHPYATPKAGCPPLPGVTVITIWPRGFGRSSPARDRLDYGFWRLAEDIEAVRVHLGLDSWAFWGTSMGGFVGLIHALQYQTSLSTLILDSTAASHHYKDDPKSLYPTARASKEFAALREDSNWETLRAYFSLRASMEGHEDKDAKWEEFLETYDANPEAYGEIMRRLEEFDARAHLGEIHIPTLILAGGKDLQCPLDQAQILAKGIPGSILKFFEPCGHGIIRENPPGIQKIVRDFIASAAGRDYALG